MSTPSTNIAAVVLAAGRSRRMGAPKLAMPWGDTTVIGQVVSVLAQAGVGEIKVVTGGSRQQVEEALHDLPAQTVFNPEFEAGEMLSTLQTGLRSLPESAAAALVVLGDQPQIEPAVVKSIIETYLEELSYLVVPSYQHRRGHPWLVDRHLWPALLALQSPQTLRDFLVDHADQILYLSVNTGSVLMDLDTPEDYQRYRPTS